MLPIAKILHPTDFSESSGPAFELACTLARDFNAELMICHVYPPSYIPAVEGMVVEIPAEEIEQVKAQLETIRPRDKRIRCTHQLLRGDPATEILGLARTAHPDLIVMGTHGRGKLSRLLLGSVAEAILRNALCPVVTVKAGTTTVVQSIDAAQAAVP